jgi:hypothetical protein
MVRVIEKTKTPTRFDILLSAGGTSHQGQAFNFDKFTINYHFVEEGKYLRKAQYSLEAAKVPMYQPVALGQGQSFLDTPLGYKILLGDDLVNELLEVPLYREGARASVAYGEHRIEYAGAGKHLPLSEAPPAVRSLLLLVNAFLGERLVVTADAPLNHVYLYEGLIPERVDVEPHLVFVSMNITGMSTTTFHMCRGVRLDDGTLAKRPDGMGDSCHEVWVETGRCLGKYRHAHRADSTGLSIILRANDRKRSTALAVYATDHQPNAEINLELGLRRNIPSGV